MLRLCNVAIISAVCEQIVKLKQIEHVIYEKRVLYSMNFPFCVRSEFTFKVHGLQLWICFEMIGLMLQGCIVYNT